MRTISNEEAQILKNYSDKQSFSIASPRIKTKASKTEIDDSTISNIIQKAIAQSDLNDKEQETTANKLLQFIDYSLLWEMPKYLEMMSTYYVDYLTAQSPKN